MNKKIKNNYLFEKSKRKRKTELSVFEINLRMLKKEYQQLILNVQTQPKKLYIKR
jgi:hypothetical protein